MRLRIGGQGLHQLGVALQLALCSTANLHHGFFAFSHDLEVPASVLRQQLGHGAVGFEAEHRCDCICLQMLKQASLQFRKRYTIHNKSLDGSCGERD